MPHCIVEHANSLDAELLVATVFDAALASQLFEPDGADIKVRAVAYQSYVTGRDKTDFVHVVLKILSGRTLQQKQALSGIVLSSLRQLGLKHCSHTVDVVDIDRDSYAKWVS